MALISLGEMLQETRRRRVAAPMFDVSNNQMIRAAVETAEEEDSPVILAAVEADLAGAGLEAWAGAALRCAARAAVPVAVMLDHATGFEWCERCADAGFSGVMIDASMLPFEENVAATREVCRRIGRRGVGVEAELGHVGSGSSMRSGGEPGGDTVYTEPGRVAEFAERTGCDALAVSIGTAHGVYASAPRLRIDLLREIEAVSPVPLVLHGGSGTPEEQIRQAIGAGIAKINICAELMSAWHAALREELAAPSNLPLLDCLVCRRSEEAVREVMRRKIRLFGSGRGGEK